MRLIQELELPERGIDSGAIGYFDARGGPDPNIVIRSAVLGDGRAYLGTGGAIVADSDPAAEYEETRHKVRPLLEALAALGAARPGPARPAAAADKPRDRPALSPPPAPRSASASGALARPVQAAEILITPGLVLGSRSSPDTLKLVARHRVSASGRST